VYNSLEKENFTKDFKKSFVKMVDRKMKRHSKVNE